MRNNTKTTKMFKIPPALRVSVVQRGAPCQTIQKSKNLSPGEGVYPSPLPLPWTPTGGVQPGPALRLTCLGLFLLMFGRLFFSNNF